MRALLCFVVLAASTPAFADARADIVDIRHGRMPSHFEALGWTSDGAFVVRQTTCEYQDDSDIPECLVAIDVATRTGTARHVLFDERWANCIDQASCVTIPTEDASRFIAAERELLATLGTLQPGTAAHPPIAGVRYDDPPSDRRAAAIAVVHRGHWRALRVVWSVNAGKDTSLRRDPEIELAQRSPDGSSLAVVTLLSFEEDDFYWTELHVDVMAPPA